MLINGGDWLKFILHVTTVSFWFYGNYSGMWYISVIMIMYLVYPLYHYFAYNKNRGGLFLIGIQSIIVVTEIVLASLCPSYYDMIKICFPFALFFIGSYFASISCLDESSEKRAKSLAPRLVYGAEFVAVDILIPSLRWHLMRIYNIISIQLFAVFFQFLENYKIGKAILNLLRWFGKYTMELYMIHLFIYCLLKAIAPESMNPNILFPISVLIAISVCAPVHAIIDKINAFLFRPEKKGLAY